MKIVFFGTSEFGAIILEKLVRAGLSPVLVVTTPDKPAGRKQILTPPPVKGCAEKYRIPVLQPVQLSSVKFNLTELSLKPDLFVVAAYGKILPKEVLDIPMHGTLNVHPSLLPKYRGSSPVQNAILNGDKETGVTIILLDEKMDHGPIVANAKFQMANDKFIYPQLHNKLAEIGAELLIKTIPDWVAGNIKSTSQEDSQATYTAILKKEDGRIDWNKEALYLERQVRALQPWPGSYTEVKSEKLKVKSQLLKILRAAVVPIPDQYAGVPPGTVILLGKECAVVTGTDALLLQEVQLEGKNATSSKEFLLGHKEFVGSQCM